MNVVYLRAINTFDIDLAMKFIINDQFIDVSPNDWPEGSTFRAMYEGDRNANEYKLTNRGLSSKSIRMIFDVISKDTDKSPVTNVNWNELIYSVNYLNLSNVDFIYPIFLTKQDRYDLYNPYIMKINIDDMKIRDPDYDIVGKDMFDEIVMKTVDSKITEMLKFLTTIPNLFVAGDYALAMFNHKYSSKYSDSLMNSSCEIGLASKFGRGRIFDDIDIYAYGKDSLDSIMKGVEVCLGWMNNRDLIDRRNTKPVRTKYAICIPISNANVRGIFVRFILKESTSPFMILNRFDTDSSCIGFEISDPDTYYALPRFVRAFETGTNTIDPTKHSRSYINNLIKYAKTGFNIAVPGFSNDFIRLPQKLIKVMMTVSRNITFKRMRLTGLQALIIITLIRHDISSSNQECNDLFLTCEEIANSAMKIVRSKIHVFGNTIVVDEKKTLFVVDDILNQGEKEFIFKINIGTIEYFPKYPRIELLIEREKVCLESFYEKYYDAKMSDINSPHTKSHIIPTSRRGGGRGMRRDGRGMRRDGRGMRRCIGRGMKRGISRGMRRGISRGGYQSSKQWIRKDT